MQPKYKRILLKLSGESLAGGDKHGINNETVLSIGRAIKRSVSWSAAATFGEAAAREAWTAPERITWECWLPL